MTAPLLLLLRSHPRAGTGILSHVAGASAADTQRTNAWTMVVGSPRSRGRSLRVGMSPRVSPPS